MGRRDLILLTLALIIFFITCQPGLCMEEGEREPPEPWAWLIGGNLSGEIGFRYKDEKLDDEGDIAFQMEFGLDYEVDIDNHWEWAIGLRTGSTGRPTRGWVRQEDYFEEKTFFIRPWNIRHTASAFDGKLKSTLGAFEFPFDQSGILFDGDVIRPGFALLLETNSLELGCSAQYLQNGETHGDAWAAACNVSLPLFTNDSSRTSLQAGYVDFLNVDTIGEAIIEERLQVSGHAPDIGTTNIISEDGNYASDFNIMLLGVEQKWTRDSDWPLETWIEYTKNLGATKTDISRDNGFAIGIRAGQKGKKDDIYIDFCYLAIEDDAALELYNRGKVGTNVKGWTTDLRYHPFDDVMIRLEGFWLETNQIREDIPSFRSRIIQFSVVYEFD